MALLRLAVSSCLLGERVRWNQAHLRPPGIMSILDEYVEWVPVCPEVAIGLGVPRDRIRLVRASAHDVPRLVQPATERDLTDDMTAFAASWSAAAPPVHGVIVAKDSPTCGVAAPTWTPDGTPKGRQPGAFTGRLQAAWPGLPFIDSGRLHDPGLREQFLDHAMMVRRFEDADNLTAFQAQVKCTVMSHEPAAVPELGRLAHGDRDAYKARLLAAMATPATRGRHVNVLQHLQGFLKGGDEATRASVDAAVQNYARGDVPLIVPLTLLRLALQHADADWALRQTYLNPYPAEWRLRNLL